MEVAKKRVVKGYGNTAVAQASQKVGFASVNQVTQGPQKAGFAFVNKIAHGFEHNRFPYGVLEKSLEALKLDLHQIKDEIMACQKKLQTAIQD
ncbi:hypothetical protein Tco_0769319 [Tanacetum coccineum]|uniref:Uncharacterized protein n=1 Tax=Tanacetum coccineum TaxID=301880 RepID=A0ABQ4Z952_9ASTR